MGIRAVRENKFRGKTHDGGWYYGDLVHTTDGTVIFPNAIEWVDGAEWRVDKFKFVDPETIGQYIDILEAYEGDVLFGSETDEFGTMPSSWFGLIKYDDSAGRIRIQDDLGDWYEIDDFDYDKVIGNIYDHQELFKVV